MSLIQSGSARLSRLRAAFDRRPVAIALAVLVEAGLFLLLLTLGAPGLLPERARERLVSFQARPEGQRSPEARRSRPSPQRAAVAVPQPPAPDQPRPAPATPPVLAPAAPPAFAIIPLSREQMARSDIGAAPARPAAPARSYGPVMGPPDTGSPGDTPRVGTAPGGEALYAAAWYREPSDDELAGYLSTASGPGWGMIACRTAPDYRVEDCVALDEYPHGSQIARAVLAAAWQFQVRPPRVGGRSMVGEWVRIRIDYGIRRK